MSNAAALRNQAVGAIMLCTAFTTMGSSVTPAAPTQGQRQVRIPGSLEVPLVSLPQVPEGLRGALSSMSADSMSAPRDESDEATYSSLVLSEFDAKIFDYKLAPSEYEDYSAYYDDDDV